ncbi:MAG: hypothetical protein LBD29_08820 [Treponema sp.]|jgi:hypothetical protein|nr:hypothetical protein [Treponema sp.]
MKAAEKCDGSGYPQESREKEKKAVFSSKVFFIFTDNLKMIRARDFLKKLRLVMFYLLCFGFPFLINAQEVPVLSLPPVGAEPVSLGGAPLFPSIYFMDTVKSVINQDASKPNWVYPEEESQLVAQSILLNDDILAYYGHPNSRNMGILGRYSMEELDAQLTKLAAEYRAVSGGRGIRKAFYIIYGTVWPAGEIGIINEALLLRYIDYALKHNMLVFIDHQIGKYHPLDAIKRMFPYLKYPNVHLALDPEWRTTKPMKEIGSVTADEINQAQKAMEDYIIANKIPGERLLVIHQFNIHMIRNRERVRANFTRVRLVHCADGFGAPHLKRDSYAVNAQATNMPIKGFKLFYNFGIPGAGYDNPLLTPKQVYELNPRPYIIMYQ